MLAQKHKFRTEKRGGVTMVELFVAMLGGTWLLVVIVVLLNSRENADN